MSEQVAEEKHPTPPCVACLAVDPAPGRQLCSDCHTTVARQLRDLPRLYHALLPLLEPAVNGNNDNRSKNAEAPLPVNLEVLNLRERGGMVLPLATWEDDWRECQDEPHAVWRGNTWQTLNKVCDYLLGHLDWADRDHLAVDEFCDEVAELYYVAKRLAGETSPPVKGQVNCYCGERLHRVWTQRGLADDWRCPGCGTTYDAGTYFIALRSSLENHPEPAAEVARQTGLNHNTLRTWIDRGRIKAAGKDKRGRPLYRAADVRTEMMTGDTNHTDVTQMLDETASA